MPRGIIVVCWERLDVSPRPLDMYMQTPRRLVQRHFTALMQHCTNIFTLQIQTLSIQPIRDAGELIEPLDIA